MEVAVFTNAEAPDRGAGSNVNAIGAIHLEQIGLQARSVELEGGMEWEVDATDFAHLIEGCIALRVVEEVAEAVLGQLVLVEILGEALFSDQVVCGDLDDGFTHFVAWLGTSLE